MNTAPAQKPNPADFLKSKSTPKETKTKSKTPVLDVEQSLRELCQEAKELKDEIDGKTSRFEAITAQLIDAIIPMREQLWKENGYLSAVRVPSMDGLSLQVVWSSNYIKNGIQNEGAIKKVMGNKYEEFFRVLNTIKVKSDLSNEQLTNLIGCVGEENFSTFFEVECNIKPTERFVHEEVFLLTPSQRERLKTEGNVRQYKPSIKR